MTTFNQEQKDLIVDVSVAILAELRQYKYEILSGEKTVILGVCDKWVTLPADGLLKTVKRMISQTKYVIENPNLMLTHSDAFDISRYVGMITEYPDYLDNLTISSTLGLLFYRASTLGLPMVNLRVN